MNELIQTEQSLSPRRAWQDKHQILTYQFKTGPVWARMHVAHVDGDDLVGKGSTQEDALLDWAAHKGVPCWREEQFLKKGGNNE